MSKGKEGNSPTNSYPTTPAKQPRSMTQESSSGSPESPLPGRFRKTLEKRVREEKGDEQRRQEQASDYKPSPKIARTFTDFLSPLKPVPPRLATAPQITNWESLFDKNLCIGTNHHGTAAEGFLIENLALMKARGFQTLIIEHLTQAEHQRDMDEFVENGTMSEPLEGYISQLSKDFLEGPFENDTGFIKSAKEYNFLEVVKAAQKAGLKIICAEKSIEDYEGSDRSSGENRILNLNTRIKEIVEKTKNIGKWVAFVGIGHVYRKI